MVLCKQFHIQRIIQNTKTCARKFYCACAAETVVLCRAAAEFFIQIYRTLAVFCVSDLDLVIQNVENLLDGRIHVSDIVSVKVVGRIT